MRQLLNSLSVLSKKAKQNSKLNKTARILADLNDKQLQDVGVSRQKLNLGASAYPWKMY